MTYPPAPGPYPGGYPSHPPTGTPPEIAARAARTTRIGKWLTWGGLVVALICVVAGIIVTVSSIRGLAQQSDDAVEINPTAQITVSENQAMQLYAPEYSTPSCRIAGPAEPAAGPNQTSSFTYEGVQVESFESLRFTTAGTYTIACTGKAIIAPPLSIGGIFSTIGGVLLAIFGGGLGVVVMIVGIVLWVMGARRSR